MSAKHLGLAVFADTRRRKGQKWQAIMEEWNSMYAEWAYDGDQVANFARDCTEARYRLLEVR